MIAQILTFLAGGLILLGALAFALLFSLIPTAIIYFAWSLLAVPIFHAPALSFLQVFLGVASINILIRLLRSK